jgi:hypothetical protein
MIGMQLRFVYTILEPLGRHERVFETTKPLIPVSVYAMQGSAIFLDPILLRLGPDLGRCGLGIARWCFCRAGRFSRLALQLLPCSMVYRQSWRPCMHHRVVRGGACASVSPFVHHFILAVSHNLWLGLCSLA